MTDAMSSGAQKRGEEVTKVPRRKSEKGAWAGPSRCCNKHDVSENHPSVFGLSQSTHD